MDNASELFTSVNLVKLLLNDHCYIKSCATHIKSLSFHNKPCRFQRSFHIKSCAAPNSELSSMFTILIDPAETPSF